MTALSERRLLSEARAVIASRAGALPLGQAGYAFYLGVMLVGIVGVPLVRSVILGLTSPQTLAIVASPGGFRVVGAIGAALAAAALLAGPVRGAVLTSPFLSEFLVGSGIVRRIALRGPFALTAIVVATAAVAVAGIVVAARLLEAQAQAVPAALFLLGSLGFSVLLTVLWLIGQSCPRRVTVPVALAVLASGLLEAAGFDAVDLATPWGWLSWLWQGLDPGAPLQGWPAIALALVSSALLAVPVLLDTLRGQDLLAQSRRWQSIATLVQTGDVAGATGVLRTPPTRGRRRRLPLVGPLPIVTLQRDLVAATRFPARLALGSAALVAAGWLVAMSLNAPSGIQWLVSLAGALLGYLAAGVWCDGLRNSAENAGRASLYGAGDLALICAHSVTPALASLVLGSLGVAIALAGGAPLAALPWCLLLAGFATVVRVFDCAKGPLPITLLMPVPTPVGDVSILTVIAWQADALLIVLGAGGGLTLAFAAAGPQAAIWLVLAGSAVCALAWRRIRALG